MGRAPGRESEQRGLMALFAGGAVVAGMLVAGRNGGG